MDELYDAMKKMKTDDEGTKRFLLALHYINHNCTTRNVTLNGKSGDVIFSGHF